MINPTSVSYEEIKQDLQDYINQLSQTDSSWKDFFETSSGQILIELLAGFGAFLLHKTYIARREAYLHQAKLLSSVTSIAEGLSYPVYKGIPPKLVITVTPSETISFPKYSVIGNLGDYDILLGEDLVANAGDTVQVTAYIGKYVEETKNIQVSSDTRKYIFVRFTQPVSEVFDFVVNDTQIEFSTKIKDLREKWVLLTNSEFSIDAFNLNLNGTYTSSDTVTIKGIYFDYKSIDFSKAKLYYDYMRITETFKATPRDSVSTIQTVAPYYADTSLIVRAREDYKKLFLIKFPYLRDVVTHDDETNPGIVYVTYLKQDLSLLTDSEKDEFLNYVDELRPMGIPLPEIVDPSEIQVNLTFNIKLSYPVSDTLVREAIENCIETYSKYLGKDLNLYDMENYLESRYDFIKIARVTNNDAGTYTVDWNNYIKVVNYTLNYI